MNQWEINELYHLLRRACVEGDREELVALKKISNHLLSYTPVYTDLNHFSDYYGRRWLAKSIQVAIDAFLEKGHPIVGRVVDIGCGTGWLGKALAQHFHVPPVLIDKRFFQGMSEARELGGDWDLIDIEEPKGLARLKEQLMENDLIVMCDTLHCLKNQKEVIDELGSWDVFIIEYTGMSNAHYSSYDVQTKMYGSEGVKWQEVLPESTPWTRLGSHTIHYIGRAEDD